MTGLCSFWHILLPSDMVAQHQLSRMGGQVDLLFQILLVIFPHIVAEQGDRHDQRGQLIMVLPDHFQQLLLFIGSQLVLEIAHQMLQHIGVLFESGMQGKPFHEQHHQAGRQYLSAG